ncbi:MAG: hypothetical protein J6T22_04555 [Bacteroidales bacterium]|nr:hypothetical protein [Bacteroidales bacterium]
MLFQRMAYCVGKIQNSRKYPKLLRFKSEGLAVGGAFVFWGLILLTAGFFLPQEYREPPFSKYICYPILAIIIFGLILALVLDNKISKNGLKKKSGWISNKAMRRITFVFVFVPFYICLLMIISAWVFVIGGIITGKIPSRF